MGASQTSIESLVGPPTVVIPLLAYADGTYSPEDTAVGVYANGATSGVVGAAADLRGYRGAMIQCVISRLPGANANALTIIPHHGPCPDFATHDPFGIEWGFYANGKGHASPGTSVVKTIFVDTDLSMPYLSAQIVIASGAGAIVGVSVIPLLPKTSPRIDEFPAGKLLTVLDSGPLNLVG